MNTDHCSANQMPIEADIETMRGDEKVQSENADEQRPVPASKFNLP